MTDYFALLDQPRRPWLDPEQLKQAFHSRALQVHPDTSAHPSGGDFAGALFAELNEAHQVLQDPKRRLQHLLTLNGHPPNRSPAATPAQIDELFPLVAAASQRASKATEQATTAANALSRSLLKAEASGASQQLNAILSQVMRLQKQATDELQQLDRAWRESDAAQLEQLSALHLRFSYLGRWISELEEKRMQLSNCLS
ncbi:MAG: J domain-containing protein [Chthoniobacterales bacterium]|nr:J domain-containing protein [Chthoniobacterales bacterium]